jgi:hypothetical protein
MLAPWVVEVPVSIDSNLKPLDDLIFYVAERKFYR